MADDDEQQRTPATEQGDGLRSLSPAIVGIGAGAASLTSLLALFQNLDPASDAAWLVIVRQREGLDVGTVREALGRACPLPVTLAADGERIVARQVYVGGPGDLLTIEDGHLRARKTAEEAGHRGMFDSLLVSIAEHAQERTVAVLLAGLGSEGAAGITATKKYGGLSIAEEADSRDLAAQGGSDPAAVADLHLPIDRIPAEIMRYIRGLGPILREEEREEASGELEAHVTQIATILRNVTSHDFHGYKHGTFIRRVQRRIQVMQIDGGMDAYVERLRGDREEVQHLFQDLLIGVTQFFRDPGEFDTLEGELPRLFEGKAADDHFRVWVLGCATGEEAYSIAILLREHMATLDHPPEVQIFATDLDARALTLARAGRYADTIANHIRPDRLDRWFVREGDTYCVSKELREMCIFSPHNIVKDAPFSRIDILSCRNLLIYLSGELQNRVIPIFHFSLRPGGVLFLGSSENVTRHQKLFGPVDRKSRVFRRLDTASRIIPDFPLTPRVRGGETVMARLPNASFEGRLAASVGRQAEAIAERYAPAYVVVDADGDVLHFSGRTGRYLEPSAGIASLSLVNLVHRDIRLDVRSALTRAAAEARRVEVPRLTIRQDDRVFAVSVIVEPLSGSDVTALAVVFQALGSVTEGADAEGDRLTTDEHVQRLEAELRVTRDRLQATIEELESTNEELKSSNEEYQSINEELQSANEEMETSKEELQSVNEELQTVNGELAHRVQDLGRANSDMKNLLESTQIATVFLDNDLRVRNFTPIATDIFHLLETDIGRPLDHVVSRVGYPELQDDIRRVLKTLTPVERQISDLAGVRHFSARVLPYRSVDNYISGAVVTFTDLTAIHQAQAAVRESEALRRVALAGGRMGTWRWDLKARLVWGDAQFMALWGFEPSDDALPLAQFTERMSPASAAEMEEIVTRSIDADEEFDGPVGIASGPTGGRWVRWRGRPMAGNTSVLHGVTFDVTEQRQAEERVRESEERFRALAVAGAYMLYRMSPDWHTMYQLDGRNILADTSAPAEDWAEIYLYPEDRLAILAVIEKAISSRTLFELEHRVRRADGSPGWVFSRAMPIVGSDGEISEWFGTASDIDARKRAEEALRDRETNLRTLVAELQHRVRNILTVTRLTFSRTFEGGGDQQEMADHFRGRLDAMARTQVLLTQNATRTADLEELIRDELLSVGVIDESVSIEGPDVTLDHKTAEALGLALHELTTNALKYGALKVPGATLDIRWTANLDQGTPARLNLVWSEQGVPAIALRPIRNGFGRELIEEALPYRLGAETRLEFRGGGVCCTMSLPLGADMDEEGVEGVDP